MPAVWWPGGLWTVDPPDISPAWATVCVALLALGAALWAGSTARRLLEVEQKREDRAEETETRRTEAEAQSLQADRVAVWTDYVDQASGPAGTVRSTYVAEIHNNSLLPIYDVQVVFFGPDGRRFDTDEIYGVLRPGGHAVAIPEAIWELTHRGPSTGALGPGKCYYVSDLGPGLRAEITFRDTAGLRWFRDRDGRLAELPRDGS